LGASKTVTSHDGRPVKKRRREGAEVDLLRTLKLSIGAFYRKKLRNKVEKFWTPFLRGGKHPATRDALSVQLEHGAGRGS